MSISRKQRRQQKRQAKPAPGSHPAISKFPEVVRSLAMIQQLREKGSVGSACDLARQLLTIEPSNHHIHLALGGSLQDAGQFDKAIACYRTCIELAPRDAAGHAQLARCLIETGDLPGAVTSCKQALVCAPEALGVHQMAGKAYERMARFHEAAAHYKAVADKTGYHADLEQLGHTLFMANDIDGAQSAFANALQKGAPPATTMVMLGRLETSRGKPDDAFKHLTDALEADPYEGYAHLQLADDLGGRIDVDRHIELVQAALASGKLPADKHQGIVPLLFALGNLYERKNDYDEAFRNFEAANAAILEGQVDDNEETARQVEHICQRYDADYVAASARHGSSSEQPVFVFGLPRSGTTLVEQILASHPHAAGLGELEALSWMPQFVQDGSPERIVEAARSYLACYPPAALKVGRVVDKSISTYLHAGLALSLFPNARLINCRRHPMDIAQSVYRMYFGPTNVPFANSFERIATRFRLYERMMEHWHRTFPGRILDIRYEELVADPRSVAESMVAHIGLDWDEACLAFHKSRSVVHTASLTQVRQPIYANAVNKWQRYGRQFESLAENIADLVCLYEGSGFTQSH